MEVIDVVIVFLSCLVIVNLIICFRTMRNEDLVLRLDDATAKYMKASSDAIDNLEKGLVDVMQENLDLTKRITELERTCCGKDCSRS